MPSTQALQKYLEALTSGYELLAEASSSSSERGYKVSTHLISDIVSAQREALGFAKRIAADPEHLMSTSYSGVTEAAVAAQGRAFAFAQLAYSESLSSGEELRTVGERLAEVNKEAAEAATELARTWSSMNPLADMFTRSMDTMRGTYGMPAKAGSKK
jgi:hypothetical protein